MHVLKGSCHCGNVTVEITLAHTPDHYHPRVCDCDFCYKHGASYISDPDGSLVMTIADPRALHRYHQGSNTADMLICRNCGVLVGAMYKTEDGVFAAINAMIIDAGTDFGEKQAVSPKLLATSAKTERWEKLWFNTVSVVSASA